MSYDRIKQERSDIFQTIEFRSLISLIVIGYNVSGAMSNKNMMLYWGSGSPPCWKAMICMAEKGLWEGMPNKLCSFSQKEHKSDEVLKLNQRGQMPTFKDGNAIVNEGSAICMYLEDKYSNDKNRLFPSDPDKKAQVYQKMFETANLQSKVTEPIMLYMFRTPKEKRDENYLKEKYVEAAEELQKWNKYLEGKDYLCGDTFTMADVFFFPMIGIFVRNKASFANSPNLQRYYDKVSKRPSIQAAWPPHWRDSPSAEMMAGIKA